MIQQDTEIVIFYTAILTEYVCGKWNPQSTQLFMSKTEYYTAGGKAPEVTTKKNNKIHSNIVVI